MTACKIRQMPRPPPHLAPPMIDDGGGEGDGSGGAGDGGAGAQSDCRIAPTLMRHNDGGAAVHLLMGRRMNTNGFINVIVRSGALSRHSAAAGLFTFRRFFVLFFVRGFFSPLPPSLPRL